MNLSLAELNLIHNEAKREFDEFSNHMYMRYKPEQLYNDEDKLEDERLRRNYKLTWDAYRKKYNMLIEELRIEQSLLNSKHM